MKRENKQRGFILLETILAMIMMMFLTYGFVVLYGGNFSLLDGGRTALQAQMIAQSRAAEISVTSFDNLNSVDEARTPVAGTDFDREVVVGAEVDLGGGNKERPIDVYVYKNGDPTDHLGARFKLHLTPTAQGSVVRKGMILAWSGSPSDVPVGWALCDGNNGTPDLRGRFIFGTSPSYAMGSSGGETSHVLTANEMPSHSHSGGTSYDGTHNHGASDNTSIVLGYWTNGGTGFGRSYHSPGPTGGVWTSDTPLPADGGHSHSVWISNSGGNQAHNTMPPYYVLAYIMRIL